MRQSNGAHGGQRRGVAGPFHAGQPVAGVGRQQPGQIFRFGQRRRVGQGAAQVFAQADADRVGEGAGMLQARVEIVRGIGEAEGLQTDGLAAGVLPHHHEVAGVGDQYLAVTLPVAADLLAVGGEPGVVSGGLDLHHAALGELAAALALLLGLALTAGALGLARGVESKVGMAGALVGEFGHAEHLGAQGVAHRVEHVVIAINVSVVAARRAARCQAWRRGGLGAG